MKAEIYSGADANSNKQQVAAVVMHKESHTITKPKIRIIHIVAPEIIKTDVENFRDLVQRLTGNNYKSPAKVIKRRRSSTSSSRKLVWTNNMHTHTQQDHHQGIHQVVLKKEPVVLIQDHIYSGSSTTTESSSSNNNNNNNIAVFSDHGFGDIIVNNIDDDHDYNSFMIQDLISTDQMNMFGGMHLC